MSDLVVTIPKNYTHPDALGKQGLAAWIAEGDAAGDPWSGTEWGLWVMGPRPNVGPDDRVYIVCEDRLRGYTPMIRLERGHPGWELIRGDGAVAVTIPNHVGDFRGWRYRWWRSELETAFPDWKTP